MSENRLESTHSDKSAGAPREGKQVWEKPQLSHIGVEDAEVGGGQHSDSEIRFS